MAFVITAPCVSEKNQACIDVCPVDCIKTNEADQQCYIDPNECIDCAACESACPVTAIFAQDAVPSQYKDFIKINAAFFAG